MINITLLESLYHHRFSIATVLCILFLLGTPQINYAQNVENKITFELKDGSLDNGLQQVGRLSGFHFSYAVQLVSKYKHINIAKGTRTVSETLELLLSNTNLQYIVRDSHIMIIVKKSTARLEEVNEPQQNSNTSTVTIQGWVVDAQHNALPGVNVYVKGKSSSGAISDKDGTFLLNVRKSSSISLTFSFVGYKTVTKTFNGRHDEAEQYIIMEEQSSELGEVVVTGMFDRRAESFTGSATTFKREDLLKVGNENILKSLKNLDPSFQIFDNLSYGSDPNKTPEIQMRGKTSFPNLEGEYSGNPNEPLFILDGFETTLEKVYDLDMNRVASITLLKDAAAKAIYGSKAGNGVVVIETIRPKMGELHVSYNGDLNVEVPDLTGYNLMNASEKFAFEVERGMYKGGSSAADKQSMQELYELYRNNILKGVDTNWLTIPLRAGIGQKHSLMLEGGDQRMRYSAGLSYNQINGVMKKSNRNTFSIYTTLSYNFKNLIFRNTVEFTRNNTKDSPYGSFSEYSALNPYWIPYDEKGNPVLLLGSYGEENFYNPLYNASLNTKSTSFYTEVRDNFSAEWKISNVFKLTGSFSYTRQENGSDLFYPPSHTMFIGYDEAGKSDQKGKYTQDRGSSQSIQSNIGINFNKMFGKHLIFANITGNVSSKTSGSNTTVGEGFGNDEMDNLSFATQYEKDGSPSGSESTVHEIGIIGAMNYSYDDRYLFDASLRSSGSSMYGSSNRWGMFWSLGAGWNLHKEPFMKRTEKWLNQLKLRTSMGYTGTQNFSPYQARARYSYLSTAYDGQLGAQLMGLPNNALRWQRNMDYTIGVDFSAWQSIMLKFDYYISTTDDLLSDITAPPSLGFATYKENLGKIENKGIDVSLSVTPWRNNKKRGWLTLTASALHNTNKIKKIYDIFKASNDSQNSSKDSQITNYTDLNALKTKYTNPSTLYYEGQSMTAIWGVRSAGIDPMTGKEVFYDKDGNKTYTWSSLNQVVIGDTQPKLSGNIGISAGYQGFSVGLNCSYKIGGDLYNSTLISKVENATGRENLDKRILDSWRKVGDIAPYKACIISSSNPQPSYTKPTSRFVEKENELYISTMNISYDFYKAHWLKKIGMERLKLTYYMNELLRFSSIEIERGTSYPFARTYSLTLQATF